MLHRTDRFTGLSLCWGYQSTSRKCRVIGQWLMVSCPVKYQPISPRRTPIQRRTTLMVKPGLPHHPIKSLWPEPEAILLCYRCWLQLPPRLLYSLLLSIHFPATSQLLLMVPCICPIRTFRQDPGSTEGWIKARSFPPCLHEPRGRHKLSWLLV